MPLRSNRLLERAFRAGLFSRSTWLPTSLGSSLAAWYKADAGCYTDAGTTSPADGQTIQQINDHSGNGRHATQATGTKRATWRVNRQNGLPCLVPDGIDDGYSITMSLPSGSFSMFSAQKPGTASGVMSLLDAQTGRLIFNTRGNDATSLAWYDGSYHNIGAATDAFAVRAWVLESGGNGEVFLNGTSLGVAAYTAAALGGAVGLLASYDIAAFFLDQDFGECFLVDRAVTAAERVAATAYLTAKWRP